TSGAQALGYLALLQVTRRQGGTNSRRYPSNGYVPNPNPNPKTFLNEPHYSPIHRTFFSAMFSPCTQSPVLPNDPIDASRQTTGVENV
ncbi:hypothetical protein, partial [Pseudomonas sp. IT-P294]|uniref:hypothetical protein n=1 Tax=Pseudomonas sp. IT-P294 TaxID=3026454 RepID=UPI0039E067E9